MNIRLVSAQQALEEVETLRGGVFYPTFPLAPPTGWMNDPNGLIYQQDVDHAFYQYYPFSEN